MIIYIFKNIYKKFTISIFFKKKLFEFVCQVENGISIDEVDNLSDVKSQIMEKLQVFADLKPQQAHEYKPLVYHLDVAAMYPNIILTNRLQPVSVVDDKM